MSDHPTPTPDPERESLRGLFWDYLQGELSPEDARSLGAALERNPEAAGDCKDLIELAVMTRELCQRGGAAREMLADTIREGLDDSGAHEVLAELARLEGQAPATLVRLDDADAPAHPQRPAKDDPLSAREVLSISGYLIGRALRSRPALYAYAAGLALFAAVLLVPWGGEPTPKTAQQPSPNPSPQAAPTAVATLTDTHDAQWAAFKLAAGDTLYAKQRLTLTEGFAEITTNRGAVAILEAPVTIRLLDHNALRLESGKLVGICETDASKGFVVRTEGMDVTDLGTRFGVDSAADATSVHVLQGTVRAELVRANGHRGGGETLSAGEAAQSSHAGDRLVRIEADPDRFAALMPDRFLPEGTGFGLAIGDVDPNWRVVAINGSPVTEEVPIRVTDKPEVAKGRPVQYEQSPFHWLVLPESLSTQSTTLSRTYTVRCRFDRPRGHDLDATGLMLGFQGGRAIDAVRVNGHSLRLPEAMTDRGTFYNPFEQQAIDRYLVEGANTIEIDLYDTDENTTFRAALELRPSTP